MAAKKEVEERFKKLDERESKRLSSSPDLLHKVASLDMMISRNSTPSRAYNSRLHRSNSIIE